MDNEKQHGDLISTGYMPSDPNGRGNHVIQGFNPVTTETVRNAIVQTSLDKGRVINQTAGNFPGWYIGEGVTGTFTRIGDTPIQEMHKVTAGEVTAGYFTLANNPINAQCVCITVAAGIRQVNKQCVGTTGITPDFDVLTINRVHINNNGGATGLSGDIIEDDVVIIDYHK